MHLQDDGLFSYYFNKKFEEFVPVNEFWKSVSI